MAGISDDHIASDLSLEWLWITTAIELVARYMPREGAREAAWEFLLIELHAKRIRYRFHGQAKYTGWFFPLDYFWLRDDKLITHEITADATVIRSGIALVKGELPPPMERRPGFERLNPGARDNEERYVFDPHGRTTVVRLRLVQLHRGDILRRLQERGFLPLQQELSLSTPTTIPPVVEEDSQPMATSSPAPPSTVSSTTSSPDEPAPLEQREEAQTPGRTIHNEQPPVTTHKERLIWLHRTMRNNPRQQGENLDLWCNRLALMMMQDERVTKKWTGLQIKRRRLDRPKD